jgi:tetratricopeptide (TPR) repeat protein
MSMETSDTPKPARQQERPDVVSAAAYLKEALLQLRGGRRKDAYSILLEASMNYPDHPYILSYFGWLQAAVEKKYQSGLADCKKAFDLFKTSDFETAEKVYPCLYLNLGRTFLVAGKKKDAFENFQMGLKYDRSNAELKKEMRLLGMRKKPPLSFLSRTNFLNIIIGKLFHSKTSHPQATR